MSTPVKVEAVKRGEYVKRKPDAKAVYIRGLYCKSSKTYALHDTNDVHRVIHVKKGTVLHVGFTY